MAFFTLSARHSSYVRIFNESVGDIFCKKCARHLSKPNYENVCFAADKFVIDPFKRNPGNGLERWPMGVGSDESLLLHEDVVNEFIKEGLTGVRFHQITQILGKVLETLPSPPPKYYKAEAVSKAEFIPSPEDFVFLDCVCKLTIKEVRDYKKPFVVNHESYDGSDFFSINHYNFWICVNRKVVDVLIKNDWAKDFGIGATAFPGSRVTDFGPTWYEDTIARVKTMFPDATIEA